VFVNALEYHNDHGKWKQRLDEVRGGLGTVKEEAVGKSGRELREERVGVRRGRLKRTERGTNREATSAENRQNRMFPNEGLGRMGLEMRWGTILVSGLSSESSKGGRL